MFVNDSRKFVFVHVPNTGGTSITKQLSVHFKNDDCRWELCNDNQHLTACALREKYSNYFFFSFVRNPWDRMVSFYHFKKRQAIRIVKKVGLRKKIKKEMIFPSFDEFVRSLCKNKKMANLMVNSQKSFLCSIDGEMMVDSIGRFECLRNDYGHVLARVTGLAFDLTVHENKSERKKDCWSYYDEETIKLVHEFWKEDVEFFGYDREIFELIRFRL